MPVRATKRGADRTPLDRECDVLICGASFAGLAVARELADSGASVLLVDRYEIGERQTSACGIPTAWLDVMGLQESLQQTFDELVIHTPHATVRYDLPWTFSTFDYRTLCGLLADQAGVTFETAEVIDQARWMHTGDVAVMDREGYLTITGRIKDMVIRGGENVYPREIEEFLHTHPDIVDVQVIGVPDARYGEELCAWVRLRPGAPELTTEALRHFAAGELAHYKIPRYVHMVEEFPMTVTGKVRKVEMRERSRELLGLGDIAAMYA